MFLKVWWVHTGTAGETKCPVSPQHLDADPVIENLDNCCATSLHLVCFFFIPLFSRAQLHLHKYSI